MAKMNSLAKQGNNLFNLKSFNSLKKDQTNIKILKNSSFDSSFNSVQSLNINLSQHLLLSSPASKEDPFIKGSSLSSFKRKRGVLRIKNIKRAPLCLHPALGSLASCLKWGGEEKRSANGEVNSPKYSAILRAIRSIRLNRDEWKLIRYINLMNTKGANKYIKQSLAQATALNAGGETLSLPKGTMEGLRALYNKIFSYNNIISKNILLRNMKYNFLKSTLSSILKKKIRRISEVLEDKPIKNYVLYSYLKNCIFTSPYRKSEPKAPVTHLNLATLNGPPWPLASRPCLPACLSSRGRLGSPSNPKESLRQDGESLARGRTKLSLNKYKGKKIGSFINYNKIIGYKFNSTFYQALPHSLREGDLRHSTFRSHLAFGEGLCLPPTRPKGIAFASLSLGEGVPLAPLPTLAKGQDRPKAHPGQRPLAPKEGQAPNPFFLLEENGVATPMEGLRAEEAPSLLLRGKGGCYTCLPLAATSPRQRRESLRQDGGIRQQGGLVRNRGNIYIKDIYKLLFYLFKSMYCLISKPVLKYTNDKITIQLFYYLNIPKKKVFRFFSISYINSIKKKWLAQSHLRFASGRLQWRGEIKKDPLPILNGGVSSSLPLSEARERGNFIYPSLGPNQKHDIASPLGNLGRGKVRLLGPMAGGTSLPRGNTKIYIRWKLRKAISRLKFKIISSPCLSFKTGAGAVPPSPPLGSPAFGEERLLPPLGEAGKETSPKERLLRKRAGNFLLFKLRKFNLTAKGVFQNKFKLICAILSKKFNKPVELQLIRLHHPYHDSNILVNLLSLNIKNKRKKARVAIQKIYNKKPVKFLNDPNLNFPNSLAKAEERLLTDESLTGKRIPAFLSGLNIKIAGRLMGEPIIPRKTRKVFGKGASATGKVNYLDVARITKKNRKGAYTIKITSGQNFF